MNVSALASMQELIPAACATIQDYPHQGILFYDVTTLFANAEVFKASIDEIARLFEGTYDVVAGVEARGFLMASALAYASGKGIMTVRKAGKLPRETYREEYELEYGTAAIEIHCHDFAPGTRVLLLDDILATGGTLVAATKLIERAKLKVAGIGTLLELKDLGGREALAQYSVFGIAVNRELIGVMPLKEFLCPQKHLRMFPRMLLHVSLRSSLPKNANMLQKSMHD